MLHVANLAKQYGAKQLFDDLTWQVDAGARVGLVGANGAGKTTLLRIVAGQEQADAGGVSLGPGERMAYLPQEAPRVDEGSVRERVEGGAVELQRLAAQMAELTEAMANAPAEGAIALASRYDECLQAFTLADGHSLRARAESILGGLGFTPAQIDGPLTTLSGGWWMRAELARLLLARPDYLLLDEPTNHLDEASLGWLEQFLQGYAGSWVVISHDRTFLNNCTGSIAELRDATLTVYPGNYDAYLAAQAAAAEQAEAAARNHAQKHAQLSAFVDRFGAKASKAAQAQSRKKQLDKLGPAPTVARRSRSMHLRLPEPPRSGQSVLRLEDVAMVRGSRQLLHGAHIEVSRGQKLAICGPNGAGKTTLLQIAAGLLAPTAGKRTPGHNVLPYYFAQHQLQMLDAKATVYDSVAQAMPTASRSDIRGLMGAFLFGNDAVDRPVGALSGGEKARLALAKMLAQPVNFLLLDEPTNHLDLASREALEAALVQYAGTVLFVSHDRTFLAKLATDVVELPGDGRLLRFAGDWPAYTAYRRRAALAEATTPPTEGRQTAAGRNGGRPTNTNAGKAPSAAMQLSGAESAANKSNKENYVAAKQARAEAAKRKRELERVETQVAQHEAQLAELDGLLSDPDVYADTARASQLLQKRGELADAVLPALMDRWEALQQE